MILPNSIFKSSRLIFDYLGKEEILRMENRFDQVFLWYEPIDLTEEMIRLYREHYHLSDEEIFNNEFLKHDRIMAQEEFDSLISKSAFTKDV